MLERKRHQWCHSELGESCQRVGNLLNSDHSQEVRISKIVSSQWYIGVSEILNRNWSLSKGIQGLASHNFRNFLDRICTMWVKPLLKSAKVYMVTCNMQIKMPYPDGLKIPKKNDTVEIIATTCWWIFLTQKSSWFWGVGTVLAPSCTFTGPILRNHIPWGLKRVSLSATSLGPSGGQRVSARCLTWCGTRGHGRITVALHVMGHGKIWKKHDIWQIIEPIHVYTNEVLLTYQSVIHGIFRPADMP